MRWTRRTIIEEIRRLHKIKSELNYATAEAHHLNLVRAAAWHFGTWRHAVETAGIDYDSLLKYQRWTRPRIIQRIQQLHAAGADLSWRAVSLEIDPPLAAAALRPNGFPSWREAIAAAGLDINDVARYQYWDQERVIATIQQLQRQGVPLSSKSAQEHHQPLFCAARRRFGSWDNALAKAGLNAARIRLRRPTTAAPLRHKPLVRSAAAAKPGQQPAPRPVAAAMATAASVANPSPTPATTGSKRAATKAAPAQRAATPTARPRAKAPLSKTTPQTRAAARRKTAPAPS